MVSSRLMPLAIAEGVPGSLCHRTKAHTRHTTISIAATVSRFCGCHLFSFSFSLSLTQTKPTAKREGIRIMSRISFGRERRRERERENGWLASIQSVAAGRTPVARVGKEKDTQRITQGREEEGGSCEGFDLWACEWPSRWARDFFFSLLFFRLFHFIIKFC